MKMLTEQLDRYPKREMAERKQTCRDSGSLSAHEAAIAIPCDPDPE
jgi:hypothetical protein